MLAYHLPTRILPGASGFFIQRDFQTLSGTSYVSLNLHQKKPARSFDIFRRSKVYSILNPSLFKSVLQ